MTDRNDPCPCGSGKKFKKCHGAAGAAPLPAKGPAGKAAATATTTAAGAQPTAPAAASPTPPDPSGSAASATHPPGPPPGAPEDERPFLVHTGRGVESERAESDRKKHLRKRIQTSDLRGTLVYNSGAFFRPPNPS